MAKFELTEEQKSAVTVRGSSVLVSAAAGSGKTRVLTERLALHVTDPEDPHDVDEFLVITYTRAAAAELRGRILAELQTRAAAEPENKRLRRQATLCCRAPIGTIHSFCTTALREFGHRIGLTPDFRVADEDKCAELREKALERTFDAAYENIETDPAFAALVDSVGAGRDDRRLAQAVLDLHAKMQSHPYPKRWAVETKRGLDVSAVTDAGETVWGKELLMRAKQTVRYWHDRFERVWRVLGADAQVAAAYGGSVDETLCAMREFLRAPDTGWDAACVRLPIPFSRLKPLKEHEEEKAAFQAERDACKKAMQGVNAMFDAPSAALLKELSVTAPAMKALIDLTISFDAAYAAEKKRLNLLDFSDLEHRAVQLLWDEERNKQTETAKTLSQRYTEIMVDEYQDVSNVQDLLFRAVSRDEKNLFMVGDVKQSVYRFRLADPSIFLKKYKDYKLSDDASAGEPRKILLQRNFRSDRVILDACNHVFENTMSEELGDVRYDGGARLAAPEGAPKRGRAVLTVLDVPDGGVGRADKTYLEGKMVARQIRALVDNGETILDGSEERPLRWGDFAVLMRSPGTAGPAFRRALAEEHIPLVSEQGGGFFASPEVQIVRSLLSVIDNPHRDVPLTAALLSPVFGFSADALAAIRARAPEGELYTALARAAKDCRGLEKKPEPVQKERTEWATEEGTTSCPEELGICEEDGEENESAHFTPEQSEKCAAFLKNLNELRWLSADIGVYELLCLLYDRFGLPEKFAALSGEARNLSLLLDCAAEFEENGYRGIYAFIKQLSRMETRGDEPSAPSGESENAVTIMSIHKSKGLEFPVVFLVNTARQFNKMDQRAPVLVHPVLGLGCKVTELARGIEYPTLARRAIASRLTDELLSEEMRVLYVAMTRARERLYISCASGGADAYIGGFQSILASPLEPAVLRGAHCMADWLVPAALLPDSPLEMKTEVAEKTDGEAAPETDQGQEKAPETADPTLVETLQRNLSFCYGYREAEPLPAKLTATSLPEYDPDGEPVTRRRYYSFRTPVLTEQTRKLTGAERGTATHIVMQFVDFAHVGTPEEIEKEIARIEALGQLDAAQAKAVDRETVLRFFASKTGQRLLKADRIWRELKFSVLCPAEKFYPNVQGEELLLQGVMDCVIEENGRLTVIDYKTDYVTDETLSEVTEHYKPQVRAYLYAAEKMFEKPAASGLLCFLRGGRTAEIVP